MRRRIRKLIRKLVFGRGAKVVVRYKSGHKAAFRCKSFTVTRYQDGRLEVSWDDAPTIGMLNPDEIESIFYS